MKQIILSSALLIAAALTYGQENIALLQGGYSAGNGSAANSQPTGYKIAGSWEFQPTGDKWTMGGSVGYINLKTTSGNSSATLKAVPICFVSRFMFGGEKFKGFVRGSLGTHITTASYTGTFVGGSDSQWGMAGGIGGGAMFWTSEKMFISAEYEWLWLSNALQDTGSIGSAMMGVGFKF